MVHLLSLCCVANFSLLGYKVRSICCQLDAIFSTQPSIWIVNYSGKWTQWKIEITPVSAWRSAMIHDTFPNYHVTLLRGCLLHARWNSSCFQPGKQQIIRSLVFIWFYLLVFFEMWSFEPASLAGADDSFIAWFMGVLRRKELTECCKMLASRYLMRHTNGFPVNVFFACWMLSK